MTALLIANERSGLMLERNLTGEDLARLLGEAGLACTVATIDGTRTVAALIEAALLDGADTVIVAGGDGTVRGAAEALAGTAAVLGVLPCGTMNLLAKDLGMPLDLEAAAVALARGRVSAIDLGEVNGEVFTCASILGMPARLARFRERMRARRGPCRWLVLARPTLRTLARTRRLSVLIQRPGRRPRRTGARAIAVSVGHYGEALGQVFTRPRLDDGVLGMHLVRRTGPVAVARMLARMLLGRWRGDPDITTASVREIVVHSPRPVLRVLNDGEIRLMPSPLNYRVRRKALRVIMPPEA